jgi:hypothetical protein
MLAPTPLPDITVFASQVTPASLSRPLTLLLDITEFAIVVSLPTVATPTALLFAVILLSVALLVPLPVGPWMMPKIEKLEQDLPLMEAQRAAFETEDLNKEKATVLRDRIDGARNALDILRVTYSRRMSQQPWE